MFESINSVGFLRTSGVWVHIEGLVLILFGQANWKTTFR